MLRMMTPNPLMTSNPCAPNTWANAQPTRAIKGVTAIPTHNRLNVRPRNPDRLAVSVFLESPAAAPICHDGPAVRKQYGPLFCIPLCAGCNKELEHLSVSPIKCEGQRDWIKADPKQGCPLPPLKRNRYRIIPVHLAAQHTPTCEAKHSVAVPQVETPKSSCIVNSLRWYISALLESTEVEAPTATVTLSPSHARLALDSSDKI